MNGRVRELEAQARSRALLADVTHSI